jgi:hypothetical protein
MTEREFCLRSRIDELTAQRDAARRSGPSPARGRRRQRCVYCGHPTMSQGTPPACPSHKDLLEVDPYYAEAA